MNISAINPRDLTPGLILAARIKENKTKKAQKEEMKSEGQELVKLHRTSLPKVLK